MECGAFDGLTECSCKFFEETMGWVGYNLEPVPWIFERLCVNRPASNNYNFGLSDHSGSITFNSVIHPVYGRETTIGAIEHSPELRATLEAEGCQFEAVEVQVLNWNDFISKAGIREIDLMVLDVEGHEASVLSGMKGARVLPKVMCVEFGHAGFNKIRNQLNELGYEYDTNSNANAFFVRRDVISIINLRHHANHHAHNAAKSELEIANSLISQKLDAANSVISDLSEKATFLAKREAELVDLHNSIISSKSWKLTQLFRRCLGRA